MTAEQQLQRLAELCSDRMNEISSHFVPGAQVTLLVRIQGKPNADFVMSNDDHDQLIAMLQRTKDRAQGKAQGNVIEPGGGRHG